MPDDEQDSTTEPDDPSESEDNDAPGESDDGSDGAGSDETSGDSSDQAGDESNSDAGDGTDPDAPDSDDSASNEGSDPDAPSAGGSASDDGSDPDAPGGGAGDDAVNNEDGNDDADPNSDQQCLANASTDADQNAGDQSVTDAAPSCSSDAPPTSQMAHISAHVQTTDGQPFQNVTVSVDGKNWSSFTDNSGNVDFGDVPVDTYTVTAEVGSAKASQTLSAPANATTQFLLKIPLTVTLTPAAPFVACAACPGSNAQDKATAAGNPTGGSFAWTTDDTSITTVAGTGANATITGAAAGTTKVNVVYTLAGATAKASAQVIAVHVDLQLVNSGKVTAAPENSTHDADVAASGGVDDLGALPMGQGRADFPNISYTSPLEVIGTVTPAEGKTLTYRWKRFISRRSWNIRHVDATTRLGVEITAAHWDVTQRTRRGFPDDDTGSGAYNNAVPNANAKMYIYDDSALTPETVAQNKVGDFIYEEKDFTYRVERNLRGTWVTCAEIRVGQLIRVKRIATTGTVTSDWQGIENSTAVRTVSATIDEGKVRGITGGTDAINIASDANN